MGEQRISAHKVTKPIQLLTAWLIGLTIINGSFLGTAIGLGPDSWECKALVIAAIANVPLFLVAIFVLQTRFRPELQEDSYYSEYLSRKTNAVLTIKRTDIEVPIAGELIQPSLPSAAVTIDGVLDWKNWRVGLNDHREDFRELRNALRSADIPVSVIFGGVANTPKPDVWLAAINYQLPFPHKIALLKILVSFGFEGYSFWHPNADAGETEDVYIGSYGIKRYIAISTELAELLDSKPDEVDLDYYNSRHGKSIDD